MPGSVASRPSSSSKRGAAVLCRVFQATLAREERVLSLTTPINFTDARICAVVPASSQISHLLPVQLPTCNMTSRRLDNSGQRHLSLVERVNIAEGDDSLGESDDDLDMSARQVRKGDARKLSSDDYLDPSTGSNRDTVEISSDDAVAYPPNGKRKARGERVAFDDDEDSDAAYKQFKQRKTVERKKMAAERSKIKKRTNKNTIVGRRPKTVLDARNRKEKHYGDPSDDDEALMESTLPDYLQNRRSGWDQNRQRLGDAGLQFPPDYDEVYFSDDERLESLKERPGISEHMQPRAPYKDIELPASYGIIPAPIAQFLRKYQVEGVEFLHELFVYQRGGILGDDMGLGKTVQVIAFLTVAFGKTGDERDSKRMRKMRRLHDDKWYPRVLLIVPGTLVANWQSELQKWGWWHIYVCHGEKGRTSALDAAGTGRLEIMITTYDTYRNHASAMNSIRWDCVIADECHRIKERTAETTKVMNGINALCRIGLTGTAIQNKYEELWTLLNWTNPGAFGPLSSWKTTVAIPLKLGQSHDATYAQLKKSREVAQKLVNNLLPRFLLRRPKSLIADQLPKKSDKVVFCPLSDTQDLAYNNFCDTEMVHSIRSAYDPCGCGSGKKQGWCCYIEVDGTPWQHFVFPALQTFQKIANHLALVLPHSPDGGEKHLKELEKLQMAMPDSWKEMYAQRDSILHYTDPRFCGKWRILKKLLKLWHDSGDKVLVFSYSVRLLNMLDMLFKMTTTYNVSLLSGKTPNDERQAVVDEFNSNPNAFVFLISTKAGGLGLNITSANKVVIVDPNWNPAYDLQAQDRAYRLGQTRDVEVFRLISAGTIEEVVYARQVYKQQQANIGYNASVERRYFRGVQDQKELKGEIFGLANLFAPTSEEIKLRDIFNKTNVAESRAGVEIAGLDLEASRDEDDDYDGNEEKALSQLAQEIIDEPATRRKKAGEAAKKPDGVMAILAGAGVKYTHENAEVIGTSKVETRISSRAQKAGGNAGWNSERAFAQSQASQNDSASATSHPHARRTQSDDEDDMDEEELVRYKYRPPEDVRNRQFCSMAKFFGFDNVTDFALVVEGWTQEQRRTALDRFYAGRRAMLAKSSG